MEKIRPTGGFLDYRSSIVFDRDGFPHISYEDNGVAKHAYWDGKQWYVQVIATTGTSASRFSSMTIDRKHNTLYLAYLDAVDSSLKVAVGHKLEQPQTARGEKETGKN